MSKSIFRSARIVKSESELEVFLEVSDKCYRDDDPRNPYGALGGYLDVARKRWFFTRGQKDTEHVLVYGFDDPVVMAALTSYSGMVYFGCGLIAESVRLGYGKIASFFVWRYRKRNRKQFIAWEQRLGLIRMSF